MLGWLFIAVGLISTIYHLLKSPLDRWTLPILLVGIIAIVAGVFLLRGARWARWLVLAWLAFHVVVSAVGCYATRRASFGRRLFPARAADFQVFSERSTRMMRFHRITRREWSTFNFLAGGLCSPRALQIARDYGRVRVPVAADKRKYLIQLAELASD